MQESTGSPLARLIRFIVCLSIIATLGAWGYIAAADVPGPVMITSQVPENGLDSSEDHIYCVFPIKDTRRFMILRDSENTGALYCTHDYIAAVLWVNQQLDVLPPT